MLKFVISLRISYGLLTFAPYQVILKEYMKVFVGGYHIEDYPIADYFVELNS